MSLVVEAGDPFAVVDRQRVEDGLPAGGSGRWAWTVPPSSPWPPGSGPSRRLVRCGSVRWRTALRKRALRPDTPPSRDLGAGQSRGEVLQRAVRAGREPVTA